MISAGEIREALLVLRNSSYKIIGYASIVNTVCRIAGDIDNVLPCLHEFIIEIASLCSQ